MAIYFSTVAFGGDLNLAQVGAAYLVGSAIADGRADSRRARRARGGGDRGPRRRRHVQHAAAVPAVFLFRLATFWLPILPGWIAFNHLRREEFV